MDKTKFDKPNILAEEALLELRNRIEEITAPDIDNKYDSDILKMFKVSGEPNFGEKYIIVKSNRTILLDLLQGKRNISSLTINEWNMVLGPCPSNRLIYKYFRKLHNAFKVNVTTKDNYESAYLKINELLQMKWDSTKHKNS